MTHRLWLRFAVIALLGGFLSGCGTLYIAQAARGQLGILHARKPITTVIADPAANAHLKATLRTVLDARNYASRELALPDNRSYRTFAELHRPYVVWNVVAAPEFSVEPRHWCFPVAGCVAYRGYFSRRAAHTFANALASVGDDVTVYGVSAYSTLGKFADPVLSSMIGYGDVELAAIIFHELAHQLIYVKNDSAFNESFATTVEETGLKRWLAARGRESELRRHIAREARQARIVQRFTEARTALAQLYAADGQRHVSDFSDRERLRAAKREILAVLAHDIRAIESRDGVSGTAYDEWIDAGLNNAHLASVATYYDCVPGFERLLREAGGVLPDFYARVREAARLGFAERHARLCIGSVPESSLASRQAGPNAVE